MDSSLFLGFWRISLHIFTLLRRFASATIFLESNSINGVLFINLTKAMAGCIENAETSNLSFLKHLSFHWHYSSYSQVYEMLRDYMRSYNTTFHRGIQETPMERFPNSKELSKTSLSRE